MTRQPHDKPSGLARQARQSSVTLSDSGVVRGAWVIRAMHQSRADRLLQDYMESLG